MSERDENATPSSAVLILYNLPGTLLAQQQGVGTEADAGVLDQVAAVTAALHALGRPCRALGVGDLRDVCRVLTAARESTVFNLVESLVGELSGFALVPALCTAFGKAVTGNSTSAQFITLDKAQAKAILNMHGVRTPSSAVAAPNSPLPALPHNVERVIIKPIMADASEGIDADSVVDAHDTGAVQDRVNRIHSTHGQPALIEAYVHGRELNVSVLEGRDGRPQILPLAEIEFVGYAGDRSRIVDYAAKWDAASDAYHSTRRKIPARLPEMVASEVKRATLAAWHAFNCCGYARVDMRLDADLNPYVLEINPNPDISPDAGFSAALAAAGIPYEYFVDTCLRNAETHASEQLHRQSPPPAPMPEPEQAACSGAVTIRRTIASDRDDILTLVRATEFFHPHELDVAAEVLDDALSDGPTGHYQSYAAEVEGTVAGWICFGATPCTEGTYDIYWLAVSPAHQRRGIGRRLLAAAERKIAVRAGHLAVVETSGRPQYDPSRTFYVSVGYRETTAIEDFYAPGDPKIILTKPIAIQGLS